MHIIWDETSPQGYYIYDRQTINFSKRMAQHTDPLHQLWCPSLHYFVFRAGQKTDAWVILADLAPIGVESRPYALNLMEMWCACIFQTLTNRDLRIHLAKEGYIERVGRHLSVALPLWQTFASEIPDSVNEQGAKASFSDLLASEDPLIREYAHHARKAFSDLRNSKNPLLREYWIASRRKSQKGAARSARRKTLFKMLRGVPLKVRRPQKKNWRQQFKVGNHAFNISRKIVKLPSPSSALVRFDLRDELHPQCYAR